jgi:hypothetical protein
MISRVIPNDLKEKTWVHCQQNNMGNRGAFDGSPEQQYTGLLGENMLRICLGLSPVYNTGFDGGYDLIINRVKIDVKTMGRSVDPKPHYVNNFVGYQKNLDAELFVFCSINKTTNTFWICGIIAKDLFLATASFFPSGSLRIRSDNSEFRTIAPLYEIQNEHLVEVKEPINIWAYTHEYADFLVR